MAFPRKPVSTSDHEPVDDEDSENDLDDGLDDDLGADDDLDAFPDSYGEPLPALPLHLKLPLDVELVILDFHKEPWDDLWLNHRLVCTAWCKHIESRARRKWLRRAHLHFANGLDHALKLIMTSHWNFQRLEDDGTAVFQDTECADEYKERIARRCERRARPDVVLGYYVFDVAIPGITFDWPNLTARVPWRALVVRVFAEEAAVAAERRRSARAMHHRAAALMRPGAAPDMSALRTLMTMFGEHLDDAYRAVRKKRCGADDRAECERLKTLRYHISFDPIDSEDDEEEAERARADEQRARERTTLVREQYRLHPELLS